MQITVNSMFSRYALQPASGLDFGAQLSGTTSAPRAFELHNHGRFAFSFEIRSPGGEAAVEARVEPSPPQSSASPGKGKSQARSKAGAADEASQQAPRARRAVGPFVLQYPTGAVEPGASARVEVVFDSAGHGAASEVIRIHVQGRGTSHDPDGAAFALTGDSVIPRLDLEPRSVFEEHEVMSDLSLASQRRNVYGTRDQVRAVAKPVWLCDGGALAPALG